MYYILKKIVQLSFQEYLLIFIAFLASTLLQKVKLFYFHLGLGVLIAWCASSLFSSHFSTFTEGRFIYIWLGIMLASESNKVKC